MAEKEKTAAAANDEAAEENGEAGWIWVVSNRLDDRVVLWERDRAHQGGEAFIGGSAPARVGHTPEIDRLLHEGIIVEVSEPIGSSIPSAKDYNPKKPQPLPPQQIEQAPPAQPGAPAPLGRELDPDLISEADRKRAKESLLGKPEEIARPKGAIVPERSK